MNEEVDIVITWVDGADPEWQKSKEQWRKASEPEAVVTVGGSENDSIIRYRDWGTLPYLFRGIERFAPWVRRVHFVTCGHLPECLDTRHSKLNIVKHSDFIPPEYLPTFASRPIELNVHRIEGLAERFVLMNDDMFLCRELSVERFFAGGLPGDMARLSLIAPSTISHTVLNMVEVMNRRYDRREVMRHHLGKWYSPKYGVGNLLKTLDLSVWNNFAGFADTHMPQPYLKETFTKMWAEEGDLIDATCRMRFRSPMGVNHWLMRYEQLLSGQFSPVGFGDARLDELTEERIADIDNYIREQKYSMICLNDSPRIRDFEVLSAQLRGAFEAILPEKSSYEL
jgi:hypothetical protein